MNNPEITTTTIGGDKEVETGVCPLCQHPLLALLGFDVEIPLDKIGEKNSKASVEIRPTGFEVIPHMCHTTGPERFIRRGRGRRRGYRRGFDTPFSGSPDFEVRDDGPDF